MSRSYRLTGAIVVSTATLVSGSALALDNSVGAQLALVSPPSQEQPRSVGEPLSEPLPAMIERLVMDGALDTELGADTSPGLVRAARAAYARELFRPIWTSEGAAALVELQRSAFSHGLVPERVLQRDLEAVAERRFADRGSADAAEADLLLTAGWLRLASAASGGLAGSAGSQRPDEGIPGGSDLSAAIRDAGQGDPVAALERFEPRHPQYRSLETLLHEYREIRATGGWPVVPEGEMLRPGDRDPRVPALRSRLRAEGYLASQVTVEAARLSVEMAAMPPAVLADLAAARKAGSTDPMLLDEVVESGLRRFQGSHGLETDGVLGPKTLAALNESVDVKIRRIVDTMEQWRKLPLGPRFVWANIPSYSVEGWNAGRREIEMRAIVGQPDRQTPVFSDEIEFVVPNPRWYVPVSIATRDKAPKLAQDPTYALRKGFSIIERSSGIEVSPWTVDWTDGSAVRRYRLVQAPGAGNALGQLKILFPNQHSVYMHGTPQTGLFDRSERAFSSGCVRLERPVDMAHWLAGYDSAVKPEAIDRALETGERRHFRLGAKTPVHVTYFTVTVADDGSGRFWRDIYDRGTTVDYPAHYADLPEQRDGHRITTASR